MSTTITRPETASPGTPGFWQAAWLVAEREISTKLRSRAFLISFAVLFVAALALVLWAGFSANDGPQTRSVAATPDAVSQVQDVAGLEVTEVVDRAAAEELVRAGDVDGAVVTDAVSPRGLAVIFDSEPSQTLLMQLSELPTVEILNPGAVDPLIRYFVAIAFGFVFLLSAQIFGQTIAQSVVEEKSTRVVELLISAVPVRALMAGKVLGNTVLAVGQIVVLAAIAVVGLTVTDQIELLQGLGSALVWFTVFFLFGFILLAALFAAAAAMVSRQEDIGSTTTPLLILIMAPYFLVIFFNDNPLVLSIMSYVPFSAPVGMPMRLYLGEALWWEPLVSLAILVVTCVLAIVVGSKIYENSLLRMGARVKLAEALKR